MSNPRLRLKGAGGSASEYGQYVLRSGSNLYLTYTSMQNPTEVRVFPSVEPDGSFGKLRLSTEPDDIGDWLAVVWIARNVGQDKKATFISRHPDLPETVASPIEQLYAAVARAKKYAVQSNTNFKYGYLLEFDGRDKKLKRPDRCGLVQCAVLARRGENYRKKPRVRRVLVLTKSALDSLCSSLNKRVDRSNDSFKSDPAELFECGDFLNLAGGRTMIVQKEATTSEDDGGLEIGSAAVSGSSSGTSYNKYEVKFGPKCPISDSSVVLDSWVDWEQALNFMTSEDQMTLLAQIYPIDLLRWAFKGTGLLTPSMEGVAISTSEAPPTKRPAKAIMTPAENHNCTAAPSTDEPAPPVEEDQPEVSVEEEGLNVDWGSANQDDEGGSVDSSEPLESGEDELGRVLREFDEADDPPC